MRFIVDIKDDNSLQVVSSDGKELGSVERGGAQYADDWVARVPDGKGYQLIQVAKSSGGCLFAVLQHHSRNEAVVRWTRNGVRIGGAAI